MDKNAIKKFAVWARRELISRVSQRAALYEITADGYGDQNASSVHGRLMSAEEKKQRSALIGQIKEKGYEQVMEEIAYTWFNRFSALRFMEVNGYLPTRIRVFTNDDNAFKPQILDEAINMEMDGLDMQRVYDLKNANDDDTLYKYMIITQCNALSSILPGMFQRISDYTELLFPDNLLREGSVVEQMIAMIPQEDWTDQVQIIGWLYQFYNTELKAKVFAKGGKIKKEDIPAATQLFTPDWIVRYMVENSLGRLWLEGHPNDDLKAEWKYYLDEADQEPEVQAQLTEIRKEYATLKPEDILAIDPCQGSGHILAYMFDVLIQIYEAYGYSAREAASSIVEHNIWGLDIDDRAAQLAYFSVMMKARQYDRRFFSRGIQPNVYVIQESNNLDPHCIEYFVDGRKELKSAMDTLVKELHDAKEYGSILNVTQVDFTVLYARFEEIRNEAALSLYNYQAIEMLLPFVNVAYTMAQKYHTVVTNPPYMALSAASPKLYDFMKKQYPHGRNDLYACFMEKCSSMLLANCFQAMITQHTWMFLGRSEDLRKEIISNDIINMVHLGTRAFEEIGGEVVQTVTFVLRNASVEGLKGNYVRLVDYANQDEKESGFFNKINHYNCASDTFRKVPGNMLIYWQSKRFLQNFEHKLVGDVINARVGLDTGNNDRFLRLWHEVSIKKILFTATSADELVGIKKWVPHTKGGAYRKWYGNFEYVIAFDSQNYNLLLNSGNHLPSRQFYFLEGITWSRISTSNFAVRYTPSGMVFNSACPTAFAENDTLMYALGLLNSVIVYDYVTALSPTMNFQAGDINKVPFIIDDRKKSIIPLVQENIKIVMDDWDSFEVSWNFKTHPFIFCAIKSEQSITIAEAYDYWDRVTQERFKQLKTNEEKINQLFLEIYGLEEELTQEVEVKDVSVRLADLQREVRSFISYSVGCMFGRYSLDTFGLIYAGGSWDVSKYITFQPDKDAIIPICDDEYFEDDIVGRFIKFVETVFGNNTLEENLRFIADALGGKGSSREVIRNYFINDFYNDHLKVYQKRPIYWLFDSGKKNGFKCLIYMHRYQPDTIARIRTDYVHEQQSRYRTSIADLENRMATAGTSERVKLTKQLDYIRGQAEELRGYEEKIHHLADQMIKIDLDDGVKYNYSIFQDVLAKLK